MATWQILLIVFGAAIILGLGGGALIGKFQLKRMQSQSKPVLAPKQRIAVISCLAVGLICILTGAWLDRTPADDAMMDDVDTMTGMEDSGEIGMADGYVEGEADIWDEGEGNQDELFGDDQDGFDGNDEPMDGDNSLTGEMDSADVDEPTEAQ